MQYAPRIHTDTHTSCVQSSVCSEFRSIIFDYSPSETVVFCLLWHWSSERKFHYTKIVRPCSFFSFELRTNLHFEPRYFLNPNHAHKHWREIQTEKSSFVLCIITTRAHTNTLIKRHPHTQTGARLQLVSVVDIFPNRLFKRKKEKNGVWRWYCEYTSDDII